MLKSYLAIKISFIRKLWREKTYQKKQVVLTQQTHQRWNNVDRQLSSTLFQRWYLVENESWADIQLSTVFQRWQNNVETMSIKLRWFNVDEPMLFQRWYLVENGSWINVCLSALLRLWENSIETTLSIAALICTDVH